MDPQQKQYLVKYMYTNPPSIAQIHGTVIVATDSIEQAVINKLAQAAARKVHGRDVKVGKYTEM
jgi:hypothetical protein